MALNARSAAPIEATAKMPPFRVEDHAIPAATACERCSSSSPILQIVRFYRRDARRAVIAVTPSATAARADDIAVSRPLGIGTDPRALRALAPDLRIVVLNRATPRKSTSGRAQRKERTAIVLKDSGPPGSCCMPSGRRLRADQYLCARLRRRWCPDPCHRYEQKTMRCGRRSCHRTRARGA